MNKFSNLLRNSSKNATTNPKNENWESYVRNNPTGSHKEAQELFKDLPFNEEWKLLFNGSKVIKITCGIASFASLFLCFYFALYIRFGHYTSIGVAFTICAIIEVFKGFSWSKLAKHVLKYKKYPFPLLALALGLNITSVIGSALGAYLTPFGTSIQATKESPKSLINIDSLQGVFNQEIAAINTNIKDYTAEIKKTSSNSTKRSLNNSIQEFNKALNSKNQAAINAIQEAKEFNKKELAKNEQEYFTKQEEASEKAKQHKTIAVFLTILFEFLLIGSYCFISYYLFRLHIDSTITIEGSGNAEFEEIEREGIISNNTSLVPAINKERRKIGFETPIKPAETPTTPTEKPIKPATIIQGKSNKETQKGSRQKHCACCGKLYTYKNENSKYCSKQCRHKTFRDNKKKKNA